MTRLQRHWIPGVLLLLVAVTVFAGAAPPLPQNGTAYVLVPKDIDLIHGVYRLNDYANGAVIQPIDPLFNLNGFGGKVSGLAANQQNQVFLLCGPVTGTWASAAVNFLPDPADFSLDSPIYLKLLAPSNYSNWTAVHGVRDGSLPSSGHGPFWMKNLPIDGQTYDWAMRAGGPISHIYLNGISGTQGIPLYDGVAGIVDPNDSTRVMLPSNWGAMSYWAHGSRNGPAYLVGQPLDGSEDPPGSGNFRPQIEALSVPFKHGLPSEEAGSVWKTTQTSFSCVVKRHYDLRERALDLWRANDFNPLVGPTMDSSGVLTTQDVRVWESYARGCGDNCIPGGAMEGKNIDVALSYVEVVTSTTGNRYGFNRKGQKVGPYPEPNKAALRVVKAGTSTNETLSPVSADGSLNSAVLTNASYLTGKGIGSETLRSLGVSSRFDGSEIDFLYGSDADNFVMQDSWWGRGGIGYEYFKDTGIIQKLDYQASANPTPVLVTTFSETERSKIDDIAVDGEGYLYFLRTEKEPTDAAMAALSPLTDYENDPKYLRKEGWYRKIVSSDPESATNLELVPAGQESPTDFLYVYLGQEVRKRVVRHAPVTGAGIAPEENRGYVRAGEDEWKFKLVRGGPTWDLPGQLQPAGDRDSAIMAELAVVNLAAAPGMYNASGDLPSVVRIDRGDANEILSEGQSMTFKVEGYKPFLPNDDGLEVRTPLRYIGDIANAAGTPIFSNLSINQLPAGDGGFNHDEDGDGVRSGFPSSLYEDSAWTTQFVWKVNWIDESGNLLQVIEPGAARSGSAPNAADFTATFPHPGNYLVSAEITYRYFDYSLLGPGSRPADLFDKWQSKTIESVPRLVRVKSPSNLNNDVESYITAIKLLPEDGTAEAFQNVAANSPHGRYDFPEDEVAANLGFEFEAQFVRDANVRETKDQALTTFGGIGVWDYDTYIDKFAACEEDVSVLKVHRHVYNYNAGLPDLNIYNPGWKKATDTAVPSQAECGTMVQVTNPNLSGVTPEDQWFRKDLAFITWRMFLDPTCSKNDSSYTPPPDGYEIASGSLAEGSPLVTLTPLGNRRFRIKVSIPPERIATIATPIDPETYSARLQIVYPRVAWHETALADGMQYRSLIPEEPLVAGQVGGIHCVSQVVHPSNKIVTSSANGSTGASHFQGRGTWELRARDKTLPTFNQTTPIIEHSTGDPIAIASVSFQAGDNNPVATFSAFQVKYEKVLDPSRNCDTTANNRTEDLTTPPIAANPQIMPSSSTFFLDNLYGVISTFTMNIDHYGPSGPFAPTMSLENWVGTLTYFAVGSVQDGFGTDSLSLVHEFGMPASDVPTLECALVRHDNDPPSLYVELISQADNRRWVVRVNENVNDSEALTTDPTMLAQTQVEVGCYYLDSGNPAIPANASTTVDVPGYANYPAEVRPEARIINLSTLAALAPEYFPRVRRSCRLMVNVGVEDNVSYKNLGQATFGITEDQGGTTKDLLPSPAPAISLVRSRNEDGNVETPFPRARFVADMPMRVRTNQPQVTVTLNATDGYGNSRGVVIPVTILDSTFDARVLESSEGRQ